MYLKFSSRGMCQCFNEGKFHVKLLFTSLLVVFFYYYFNRKVFWLCVFVLFLSFCDEMCDQLVIHI